MDLLQKLNALRRAGHSSEAALPLQGAVHHPEHSSHTGGVDTEGALSETGVQPAAIAGRGSRRGSGAAVGTSGVDGEQVALLNRTLADTTDTEELLRQRGELLRAAEEDVQGARHATACLAERSNAVCQAKLKRLQALRERTEAYEAGTCQREVLLKAVLEGADPSEVGKQVTGFKSFVAKCAHDGPPEEADKSNFQVFLKTFGLPGNHHLVLKARQALQIGAEDWSASALDLAKKAILNLEQEATPSVEQVLNLAKAIEQLSQLAKCAGASARGGALAQLKELETDLQERAAELKARAVLVEAKRLKEFVQAELEKDNQLQQSSDTVIGGQEAQSAAARIKQQLELGMAKGIPVNNESVFLARQAEIDLRAEAVRRNALKIVSDDQQEYREKGFVPESANKAAERVEAEIERAKREGVPAYHAKLADAAASASELRQQEGFRKREFHVAKRRNEAALRAASAS